MSVILGLNAFHADAAACLLLDGRLTGAVAEERLGPREKHSARFPSNAIRWLLEDNGLRLSDVTHVAIARDGSASRAAKARWVARHPVRGLGAAAEHVARAKRTTDNIARLAEICDEDPSRVSFQTVPVEHHLAHIASAYYTSPFDGLTAGFSFDASGDFASAMAAECVGTRIKVLDRVHLPHSLGFFYTAMCQLIGFDSFGEEYKVMGLAPYGENRYGEEMRQLVQLPQNGWFRLAPGFFGMHERGGRSGAMDGEGRIVMGRLDTPRLAKLLGGALARGVPTQRAKDIARSTQARFEEAAVHCWWRLHSMVPTERIAIAGGCALNGVANARMLQETPFTMPFLQPAASDDGTSIGAAFWAFHNVVGGRERFHMRHAFWGPDHGHERHKRALMAAGLSAVEAPDEAALIEWAADLIAAGRVIGWYQGRSEWGPRALGHRSILANPAVPNMKDIINTKIKRRESFRPFAPSVLAEDVARHFEQEVSSPFMMHVVKLKAEWRERLPAITHVDGTGRLQTVDPESNAIYHRLISAVKRRTGIGIVLNTSFNENEPIVDTPEQAVDCFRRTDMDALCLGRFVVTKPGLQEGAQVGGATQRLAR